MSGTLTAVLFGVDGPPVDGNYLRAALGAGDAIDGATSSAGVERIVDRRG